jgi:hypothetical protein
MIAVLVIVANVILGLFGLLLGLAGLLRDWQRDPEDRE